jgi:hypothetical protein
VRAAGAALGGGLVATLTLPTEDYGLLRRALDRGIRVLAQTGPDTYRTTSSREGVTHQVWARDGKANCSCELSALGHKRCAHGALVLAWIAWRAQQEGAGR